MQSTVFKHLALLGLTLMSVTNLEASKKVTEPVPFVIRDGNEMVVPEDSPYRSRLTVAPVELLATPHEVSLPGFVEADPSRVVNILPPLTGRLTELKVSLGEEVKQGQLLAVIYSPDMDQAYADVIKARDALDLATKAFERAKAVHDAGGISVKDLEQYNSTHDQAQAEFNRATARLNTLKSSHEGPNDRTLKIAAPVSGTITALNYGQGSYITDPTASLMTISNLDKVWVTVYVPENLLSSIAKGQDVGVKFSAYPNEVFHEKISFVNAVLEPDTRRNKVRITFENPDNKLKPNMYATIIIAVPQTEQIVIPPSALLMNNDTITVFVETRPWVFVRQAVTLGNEDINRIRVLNGLKASDRVVTSGGVLLND